MAEVNEYESHGVALGAEDGTRDWPQKAEAEVEAEMNDGVGGTAGDSKE
jgi:hypothetical protein